MLLFDYKGQKFFSTHSSPEIVLTVFKHLAINGCSFFRVHGSDIRAPREYAKLRYSRRYNAYVPYCGIYIPKAIPGNVLLMRQQMSNPPSGFVKDRIMIFEVVEDMRPLIQGVRIRKILKARFVGPPFGSWNYATLTRNKRDKRINCTLLGKDAGDVAKFLEMFNQNGDYDLIQDI